MKRRDLIRHLETHGCRKYREGGNHTIYKNPANGEQSPVERHREIPNNTVREVCKQLGIPRPGGN